MWDWLGGGDSRCGIMPYAVYALLNACWTRLILYSVDAVLDGCCTGCILYSVYAVLGVCCTECMLYWVYAVLGVCCTRCMLYSVYAVLGVHSWSWYGEIVRDDLTSCSYVKVELRMREREMSRDGTNYHEKLGHRRTLCASQFTIFEMAGTSPELAWNNAETRSSQLNHASHTPDFSDLLIFSTSFSSSSPSHSSLLQLYHLRRIRS